MVNSRIGRVGMAVLVVCSMVAAASDLPAQFQAPGALGALAPANIAKPRPKPPFDLTGAWSLGRDGFVFSVPPDLKLMPEAQKQHEAALKAVREGKLYRNDIGLCWPAGLPIMMARAWPVAMIQLPTAIYMIQELMNTMRVVYLDGRQHTDPDFAVRSFNGESIGHWEGGTLMIDTTNFVGGDHHWIDDKQGVPASDALHIVERYRLMDDGKALEIEFTMTDPKTWVGEWKVTKHFNRADDRDIAEVECLPDLNDHMPSVHSTENVR